MPKTRGKKDKAGADPPAIDLGKAIVDGDRRLLKRHLTEADAVGTRTPSGHTLLHLAALGGHVGIARLLIEHGADVNASDNHGKTPLHCAARGGHSAVASLLIDHGADVNAQARNGSFPLDWSDKFGHEAMTELLSERGGESGQPLR